MGFFILTHQSKCRAHLQINYFVVLTMGVTLIGQFLILKLDTTIRTFCSRSIHNATTFFAFPYIMTITFPFNHETGGT